MTVVVLADSVTELFGFSGISTIYLFALIKIIVIYEAFAQIFRIGIFVAHNQDVDSFLSIETTPRSKALLYCSDYRILTIIAV